MPEAERRGDLENRSRLDRIAWDYQRWSFRTLLLLGVIAVIQLGLGALSVYLVTQNRQRTSEIRAVAERASERAQDAAVATALTREKVCSESSDREVACRALFDRLAMSLSDAQRQELACAVVEQLRGSVARELRTGTRCPS